MAGFGRGYYGGAQLETTKPKPRSWFKIVAVVGLGAATVWILLPRSRSRPPDGSRGQHPEPPQSPQPQQSQPAAAAPIVAIPPPSGALQKQLQDDAMARGFATIEAYENSVVASAKGLQDVGAEVMLAPNLQHLAPRLLSGGTTSK